MIGWWNVVSQTSPTVFKPSYYTVTHDPYDVLMCMNYFLWGPAKWFQSYAPSRKISYILIFCDKVGLGDKINTISNSSSLFYSCVMFTQIVLFLSIHKIKKYVKSNKYKWCYSIQTRKLLVQTMQQIFSAANIYQGTLY